ncbi:Lrp/AsnC family transcriptional regulator [Sphingobium tyrosinilyticum]|uniref:Lrp/AsnC family transcriptional regulator n=1 Tax=Sphingobium tyrosinilyticum TaxID=2715436 RepID=A0ABV9F2Q4_9SPHN
MRIRNGRTSSGPSLSQLDEQIIAVLRTNGRASNQEIAEQLSVSAATISARLQRREEARAMRVVAVSDFAAWGYDVIIAVGVQVQGRDAHEVGSELAKFPEVLSGNVMNGRHDLELLVALHDFAEVQEFLYEHISRVEGVSQIDSGVAVDILKY